MQAPIMTIYRVTADNTVQNGIILGPGFIAFDYSEAVAKAIEWRQDPTLCNVVISQRRFG